MQKIVKEDGRINLDWICLKCDGSSSMMKKTMWKVGGYNAQSASHVNCISQLHQSLFGLDEDDEYLCPECFFTEPNVDD